MSLSSTPYCLARQPSKTFNLFIDITVGSLHRKSACCKRLFFASWDLVIKIYMICFSKLLQLSACLGAEYALLCASSKVVIWLD